MSTPARRAITVTLLVTGSPAALTACAATASRPSPPPPAAVVEVRDVAFTPRVVRVTVGQSVRWHFDDGGLLHGVQNDSGERRQEFDSGIRSKGTYTVTFTTTGTFDYHCEVHSMMMTGSVVVTPATVKEQP
ncbi:plastocyanin/azurin family copper-binding protein [Streptomyces sp. NPDC101175]|uniref:plastocyanin/azurin family copper-binding protein n=1 Tax=Streptomyces sp. NPDC101175 TaxID=3366123 RepID=UPI003833A2B3